MAASSSFPSSPSSPSSVPLVDDDEFASDFINFHLSGEETPPEVEIKLEPDELQLLRLYFSQWDDIPCNTRTILAANRSAPLNSKHGYLLFLFSADERRYKLLTDVLDFLATKVTSTQDHAQVAAALDNLLCQWGRLFARYRGDVNTHDWTIANEELRIHVIMDPAKVSDILCHKLTTLVKLIDDHLLIKRCVTQTKYRINELKKLEKKQPRNEQLKQERAKYENAIILHKMFSSNGGRSAIVKAFMQSQRADLAADRAPLIRLYPKLFPCPAHDVDLDTGRTYKRYLTSNITRVAGANFTVPEALVQKPLNRWTAEENREHFGPMCGFFKQLSGYDTMICREIVISTYLQLLGHNRHKVIILWIGKGNNGKSQVLGLLRRVLGTLGQPLDKSVLFHTPGRSSTHAGYSVQLIGICSGSIDELSAEDRFDEDALKRYISPEVSLAMREAGDRRKGASQQRHEISCGLLLILNDDCMPQFPGADIAVLSRFRIIRFPATFVKSEVTEAEKCTGRIFRANPMLPEILKQQRIQEQFLNTIIMYGGLWYRENIKRYGEPLPPNKETKQFVEDLIKDPPGPPPPPPPPVVPFKAWFERRTMQVPGAQVAVAELAMVYCQDHGVKFHNPAQQFGILLHNAYPDIEKKQRYVSIGSDPSTLHMVIIDRCLIAGALPVPPPTPTPPSFFPPPSAFSPPLR